MSEVTSVGTIDPHVTVNDLIARFPATVEVFNRHGIDACCGGAVPVREAAERDGADPAALVAALADAVRRAGEEGRA